MIIVSACLAGVRCRYDGSHCVYERVRALVREGKGLPLCPEQLGGLPTPRLESQIVGGDGQDVLKGKAEVLMRDGSDVTHNFLKGAAETLRVAKLAGAKKAILKQGSPSCGFGEIHRDKEIIKGMGVTAALLAKKSIEIEAV